MSESLSRRQFLTFAGGSAAVFVGLGLNACGPKSTDPVAPEEGGSAPAEGGSESGSTAALTGSITAVGATALQPLVEAAAEQFMSENPDVQITVQGGGSGQGITQIAAGSVQIGDSDVFAEEKLDNPDDAKKLEDHKICIVGMGPVVHPDIKVDDIKLEDLTKIFTGEITNWKEVGGDDAEIVVINRAAGSGTRATFENAVLKDVKVPEDFKPQEQDSSGTVAKMVAETPGAISYLAFSYFTEDFKALSVDGVKPETANIEDNSWVIWAYEHMYTSKDPDEVTQAFIDYMLSEDVQSTLVEKNGYIPTSGMKVERDADGNVTKK